MITSCSRICSKVFLPNSNATLLLMIIESDFKFLIPIKLHIYLIYNTLFYSYSTLTLVFVLCPLVFVQSSAPCPLIFPQG